MACGATIDLTTRHLSGAWRVRAIHTHATKVARGVQSLDRGGHVGANEPTVALKCLFFLALKRIFK